MQALGEYFEIDVAKIVHRDTENLFGVNGGEFLVLTNAEADEMAETIILEETDRVILDMIEDKAAFVEAACERDGRAHYLARYDGAEHVVGDRGYFVYRTN